MLTISPAILFLIGFFAGAVALVIAFVLYLIYANKKETENKT